MCGIAGAFFDIGDDTASPSQAMARYMQLRGPDSEGAWHDPRGGLSFGHRRLSIIDLDARANQPFVSQDGRSVIVFNGEIYNYQVLRDGLVQAGVQLKSKSDTEVVLELYRRQGPQALAQLRGMYAFAIWDIERRQLVLARDPYGIKPLYLARTAKGWMFASQVKALMATGLVSDTVDSAGVAGFFLWGSVPSPRTLYQDVKSVPAGSYVVIDDMRQASKPVSFADISAPWRDLERPMGEVGAAVRDALLDTVSAHLVADVPVAVLLSGGVDSGVIAGLMAERGQKIEGITVRFREFAGTARDEGPRADSIAAHYGIQMSPRLVGRDEFLGDVPAILGAMDQPSIDGVNTWFASKAVAERGYKVVLSGVGGDELFCGYTTFQTIPRTRRTIGGLARVPPLGALARLSLSLAADALRRPKLAALGTLGGDWHGAYFVHRGVVMPNELAALMGAKPAADALEQLAQDVPPALNARCDAAAVAALESTRYLQNQLLRDSDWASMAHSLELRTPFVDWALLNRLAPFIGSFKDGKGKRILASAPARPLPEAIVSHSKTGFGLPIGEWLSQLNFQAPPSMTGTWGRRWAWHVAKEFGVV